MNHRCKLQQCGICGKLFKNVMNHMRQSSCHVEPPITVVNLLCSTPTTAPILTSTQKSQRNIRSCQQNLLLAKILAPVPTIRDEVSVLTNSTLPHHQIIVSSPAAHTNHNLNEDNESPTSDNNGMLHDQDSEHEDTTTAQGEDNHSKMTFPIAANAATTVPLSVTGYNLFSKTELSHLRIMQFCDSSGCGRIFLTVSSTC